MREVYVAGVGMTEFGKFPDRTFRSMGTEAVKTAIGGAGLDADLIESGYAGHARTGKILNWECGVGQRILADCGISGIPITSVGNFCSSGSAAVREAWMAVASGFYDCVIAIGIEQLSVGRESGKPLTSDGVETEGAMGFTPPAFFGMVAKRHMDLYGTTKEQIASVAVKNRRNASLNPRAQYRDPITVEEVLESPMIVEPLTMYNCCPIADGAAAAILCSERVMKKTDNKHVELAACGLRSGYYNPKRDITTLDATKEAAKEVYERAGIGPEDVDVAEVHDCFTIAELIHYEDLGFCEKGEGGRYVEEGHADIDGDGVAVSTSGGLMSKGHPLGATGVAQLAEGTWQLRGEAGERQVEGAKVAITHTAGGFQDCDVASLAINLLKV